jgi:hypothetical protein
VIGAKVSRIAHERAGHGSGDAQLIAATDSGICASGTRPGTPTATPWPHRAVTSARAGTDYGHEPEPDQRLRLIC